MPGKNTLSFTDADFDRNVLRSGVPVLVDFWAEWCGPCRQVAPAVDAVATEYAGKAKVGKLDIAGNEQTADRYHVHAIPALLLFAGGRLVEQRLGVASQSEVRKMIDSHL